jgi:hypothetical protein
MSDSSINFMKHVISIVNVYYITTYAQISTVNLYEITPTCFAVNIPSSGNLQVVLAKVVN